MARPRPREAPVTTATGVAAPPGPRVVTPRPASGTGRGGDHRCRGAARGATAHRGPRGPRPPRSPRRGSSPSPAGRGPGSATAWWWIELTMVAPPSAGAGQRCPARPRRRAPARTGAPPASGPRSRPSGRSATSCPPMATASSWMPRQMPSTGHPVLDGHPSGQELDRVAVDVELHGLGVLGRAVLRRVRRRRRRSAPRLGHRRARRAHVLGADAGTGGDDHRSTAGAARTPSTYPRLTEYRSSGVASHDDRDSRQRGHVRRARGTSRVPSR